MTWRSEPPWWGDYAALALLFAVCVSPLVLVLICAAPSRAACRWTWACDGAGHCEHVPLCSSTIDLVPPEPPRLQPLAPIGVPPAPRVALPPVGASSCALRQVQSTDGAFHWSNVCE